MVSTAGPGLVLGDRYRLVQPLARGGMASVWVAEDTLLGRKVAVKTLHPELAGDQGLRTRFHREAVSAASLAHPAIVTTYDTGEHDGIAYIVMELVDGPTLRELIDEQKRLSVDEALRIGRWVAAALEHAHRNGIVHRDIKPANVLVPPEGPAKVTDFGIAKSDGVSDLTRTGTVVGTARYLAPEQVRGDPVDARADVYALGLLLYEMLVGVLPFKGETEMATALARLTTAPQPLYLARPDVPKALDRVVAHCLTVEPERRYASGGAIAAALDDVISGTSPAVPDTTGRPRNGGSPPAAAPPGPRSPQSPRSQPPRPARQRARRQRPPQRRGRGLLILLAIIVFVGGAAVGYLALRDTASSSSPGTDTSGALTISSVDDFDPQGDGSERPDLLGSNGSTVLDGEPTSAWSTETYRQSDFGGAKPGVGLVLTLASPTAIDALEVDAAEGGWSAQVYVADEPAEALDGWGDPVGSVDDGGTTERVELGGVEGRVVLLWITHLPSSGKLTISEVRLA